jgi:hypothetical protein
MVRAALTPDESLLLRLYRNDLTPALNTVAGDFQQATFVGYNQHILARGGWSPATVLAGVASIEWAQGALSFRNSGDGNTTVYGCYLLGGTSGVVYYARRFSTPQVIPVAGVLYVLPRVRLTSVPVS